MAMDKFSISERRACRIIGQPRASQRRKPIIRSDEEILTQRIIALASDFGRYGYRRITALLQREGFKVNHKRVERIWRQCGLKVPQKQQKRGRLWLNDGSCIRLRPKYRNHVWSYDFVADRTRDGKPLRILNIIDEFRRECLAAIPERSIKSTTVMDTLYELFCIYGIPDYIRSDNGPEFVEKTLREWLSNVGVKTIFIEPGSPWENGYIESFNGKMRDELLNGEIFDTLEEAKVVIENWRQHYNKFRPHSSLNYLPPAPEAYELWNTKCRTA